MFVYRILTNKGPAYLFDNGRGAPSFTLNRTSWNDRVPRLLPVSRVELKLFPLFDCPIDGSTRRKAAVTIEADGSTFTATVIWSFKQWFLPNSCKTQLLVQGPNHVRYVVCAEDVRNNPPHNSSVDGVSVRDLLEVRTEKRVFFRYLHDKKLTSHGYKWLFSLTTGELVDELT